MHSVKLWSTEVFYIKYHWARKYLSYRGPSWL